MCEEKAQSYRVKDKEIYRAKLACQNTKVYRVNTQLTKGTIMLLYFFCFFLHMRTLSVLDKYRANVLGPCCSRAITLFTVFPWRVTYVFWGGGDFLSLEARGERTFFQPAAKWYLTVYYLHNC